MHKLVSLVFKERFLVRKVNLVLGFSLILTACITAQPRNITDVCAIFEENKNWYESASSSEDRWGIPIGVNMAVIYQESSFRARAKPERERILWVLPGPRASSAYGYAQALDSTWDDYKSMSGRTRASRSDFNDAIDFVGWYNANSVRINNIATTDARNLYLAYHEGNTGFQRRSFNNKGWLIEAANRVQANSERFNRQLGECVKELEKSWLRRLFS
ncbi:MAG: transglycosylase SLT domain-containing protein [Gammaproteobacteria bacterium]|nr:transglycosylase SLT domain-containing protein [Gammaproteobacteria bacterium]